MKLAEFETLVDEAFLELPEEFRGILTRNGISLITRAKVPKSARRKGTIFGIFFGVPLGHPLDTGFEPTRIELYKESFERAYGNADEIKRQIIVTVVHEVAHYFGFSEEQIRKLGYG